MCRHGCSQPSSSRKPHPPFIEGCIHSALNRAYVYYLIAYRRIAYCRIAYRRIAYRRIAYHRIAYHRIAYHRIAYGTVSNGYVSVSLSATVAELYCNEHVRYHCKYLVSIFITLLSEHTCYLITDMLILYATHEHKRGVPMLITIRMNAKEYFVLT